MTQTVQTNGVQPLSKTWELSLYELQRTPQVTLLCGFVVEFQVCFLCATQSWFAVQYNRKRLQMDWR